MSPLPSFPVRHQEGRRCLWTRGTKRKIPCWQAWRGPSFGPSSKSCDYRESYSRPRLEHVHCVVRRKLSCRECANCIYFQELLALRNGKSFTRAKRKKTRYLLPTFLDSSPQHRVLRASARNNGLLRLKLHSSMIFVLIKQMFMISIWSFLVLFKNKFECKTMYFSKKKSCLKYVFRWINFHIQQAHPPSMKWKKK